MWGTKGKIGPIKDMELSTLTPEMKSGFAKLLAQAGGRPRRKRTSYDVSSGENAQSETNFACADKIHSEDSHDSSNTSGSSIVASSTNTAVSPPPPCDLMEVIDNPPSSSNSAATNSSNETKSIGNPYKRKLPTSASPNNPKLKPTRMLNPYAKKKSPTKASRNGKTVRWTCEKCTLINEMVLFTDKAPKCHVCNTVKGESTDQVIKLDC